MSAWIRWPSREALTATGRSTSRNWLSRVVRVAALALLLWAVIADPGSGPWEVAAGTAGVLLAAVVTVGYFRTTLRQLLWPSLALLVLLLLIALAFSWAHTRVPALVIWCACVICAVERLPLAVGLPPAAAALTLYAALNTDGALTTVATTVGVALAGYVVRLDAEARGTTVRLLAQERAARVAETESAALAERARIAREIHDVLAHSLSAQLVHLEAARLLAERQVGGDAGSTEGAGVGQPAGAADQLLERIVAARRMAGEGLAETRQALSALRGETAPVADFLRELAGEHGAQLEIQGSAAPLSTEAGQTIRRAAQEALTNTRKHAPGSRVRMCFTQGEDGTLLEVRDDGALAGAAAPEDVAGGGSGYGLVGMRERAELLGGTLEAEAEQEGFTVRLRLPE